MSKWQEYILCAAVHFNDGDKYEHQPKNIEEGIVVTGRRHHNCFATAFGLGYERPEHHKVTQGFITSEDRFVDRDEAAEIASECGQVDVNDFLMSEHLS